MKTFIQIFTFLITVFISFLFSFIIFYYFKMPNDFICFSNDIPNSNLFGMNLIKHETYNPVKTNLCDDYDDYKEQFNATLFNLIPVKNIKFKKLGKKIYVNPCGIPFGLKILTDSVLVVNIQEVKTINGEEFPAKIAGLKKGDCLISVNGFKINSNSQLKKFVRESHGENLKLKIKRKEKEMELQIKPLYSIKNKKFESGIWVRDSSAGIGTLTFSAHMADGKCLFGGLGHPIFDVDTGNSLDIGEGEIVEASIYDIVQGNCSKPGELRGNLNTTSIGKIELNTDCGLYGFLNKPITPHELMPLGLKHEVKTGPAYIYSTINGNKSEKFKVKIESIDYNHSVKNFIIKIVDEKLLKKTGGIVQGMSGSPIIQNGKFIGAITHVFLNDSSRGYGVFAEKMIMTSRKI